MHMPIEMIQDSNHTGMNWLRQNQLMEVSCKNVVISTLKKAYDDDSLILRMFETEGGTGEVHLNYNNYPIELSFSKYEVKTICLKQDEWHYVNMIEFE
jgi:alpha-mannosidase